MLLGANAKLYRLTTGTRATWNVTVTAGLHVGAAPSNLDEIGNARGTVKINGKGASVDATVRGSGGYKVYGYGLKDIQIDVTMLYDSADADMAALMAAFLGGTTIAIAALDGDKATAGNIGVWADFMVEGPDKSEPLAEAQEITFTLKPGVSPVAPEWVKIA